MQLDVCNYSNNLWSFQYILLKLRINDPYSMRLLLLILISFSINFSISSKKSYSATRIDDEIKIDGKLDDKAWLEVEALTSFTNWQPIAGSTPSRTTEVKIVYDDKAIYLGAYMKTENREEIQTELSMRDDIGNTDWIGFVLDTYGNGTEGSEFILAATGVQFDAKVTSNGEDTDWNEVWFSAVELTEKGWYAEMKIPYSAIRFANTEQQNWRFNIMRRLAKTGEKCSYQYLDPQGSGFLNQSAHLTGVKNIVSPIRLSLSPYITGYVQRASSGGDEAISSTGYSYNGGLDLKYGINEAFTLDMTLIPDFGQVQSDDQVLNLSPFEIQFSENRAFFTEGLDLFNKADIFYTRRVGGTPLGYGNVRNQLSENEYIENNPQETQLYNASKVSGRTNGGLGIGIFNAISGSTYALVKDTDKLTSREIKTSPFTNYNVVVLDQNLRNNSSISFINTNVWRRGSEFYDANVSGLEWDIRDKHQAYGISGSTSVSQILNAETDNEYGLNYELGFSKLSGNLRFDVEASGISNSYDNNDLGFNTETNIKGYDFGIYYNFNKGWKSLNRGNIWFNSSVNTTYDENKFSSIHFNSGFWAETKAQWQINMWTNYRPYTNDYFEARVPGRFVKKPGMYNMGWYLGSDQRKKFYLGSRVFGLKLFDDDGYIIEGELNPRYRVSDKISLFLGVEASKSNNTRGFVTFDNNEPIIGIRDQLTISNVLGATYTFNAQMSMNVRARHYWSKVLYDDFHSLLDNGELGTTTYNSNNNFSFNLMNVDLNYIWRFAPGSDLIFNWKSQISGLEFSELIDFRERSYTDGLNNLSELPSRNSISLRLIYFLNAANFL